MALAVGTALGTYHIVAFIGAVVLVAITRVLKRA